MAEGGIVDVLTFCPGDDTIEAMFTPRTLSNLVNHIARQAIGKDWNIYAALLEHWVEIVGQQYAAVTTPVKMTFPYQPQEARRAKGVLYVRLPKGLAMEFTFHVEPIRQRVNSYFGYEAIAKIVLEPVYRGKPTAKVTEPLNAEMVQKIHQDVEGLENGELKEALAAFGCTLLKASKEKDPKFS